jgi:hypothetical protein
MTATYDPEATAAGIDASRRVAWARYYAQVRDNAALLRHNTILLRHLARLALAASRSEAVVLLDPDLAALARRVVVTVRLRPRGRAILADLEREDRDA